MKRYNWKQINESFFNDIENDITNDNFNNINKLYNFIIVNNATDNILISFTTYNTIPHQNTKIDIDPSIKYMDQMFNECKTLISVDLCNINTTNIKLMWGMFNNCISLKHINLQNVNTFNVENMANMFFNCKLLEILDLSSFDTSNVTNISSIFANCSKLKRLYLDNFNINTRKCQIYSIFFGCNSLEYIRCSKKFRNWCWKYQDIIELPYIMRKGNSGTWDII